jgi:hypothetical protein
MLHRTILTATLLAWPAGAQVPPEIVRPEPADQTVYVMPVIPSEAEKKAALIEAYRRNGNSMVGPMIDLTVPSLLKTDKAPMRLEETPAEDAVWPILARQAKAQVSDVCTRHGMHKVITRGGKSWRCK